MKMPKQDKIKKIYFSFFFSHRNFSHILQPSLSLRPHSIITTTKLFAATWKIIVVVIVEESLAPDILNIKIRPPTRGRFQIRWRFLFFFTLDLIISLKHTFFSSHTT